MVLHINPSSQLRGVAYNVAVAHACTDGSLNVTSQHARLIHKKTMLNSWIALASQSGKIALWHVTIIIQS